MAAAVAKKKVRTEEMIAGMSDMAHADDGRAGGVGGASASGSNAGTMSVEETLKQLR